MSEKKTKKINPLKGYKSQPLHVAMSNVYTKRQVKLLCLFAYCRNPKMREKFGKYIRKWTVRQRIRACKWSVDKLTEEFVQEAYAEGVDLMGEHLL